MSIKPKILVAEDEPIIADASATILNQNGFESSAVYPSAQASEVASTFLRDMLTTDVIRYNVDGIETATEMRPQLPHMRIQLCSGESTSADLLSKANENIARGADTFDA